MIFFLNLESRWFLLSSKSSKVARYKAMDIFKHGAQKYPSGCTVVNSGSYNLHKVWIFNQHQNTSCCSRVTC